jgi:hypothetical protein
MLALVLGADVQAAKNSLLAAKVFWSAYKDWDWHPLSVPPKMRISTSPVDGSRSFATCKLV